MNSVLCQPETDKQNQKLNHHISKMKTQEKQQHSGLGTNQVFQFIFLKKISQKAKKKKKQEIIFSQAFHRTGGTQKETVLILETNYGCVLNEKVYMNRKQKP